MNKIKPKKLKKGDTIEILAVSGKIKEIERIKQAEKYLKNLGYNVIVSDTCKTSHRYMSGKSDKDNINALHRAFLNKKVNAIFCARGGFGTLRLINKIDWNIIENNPKIFAGYSDITVLLTMIYKKTKLITFHSPMPNGDFSVDINEYTTKSFFNTLEAKTKEIKADKPEIYKRGCAKGILWGGNLSSLVSLAGTDFIPNENIILFLEDLNEPVYKIDKMLTQLFNIEKFRKRVKGIAFGEFQNVEPKCELKEVIKEKINELDIPSSGGFKITHGKVKDTLPVGVKTLFNANTGTIKIVEPYLTNNQSDRLLKI